MLESTSKDSLLFFSISIFHVKIGGESVDGFSIGVIFMGRVTSSIKDLVALHVITKSVVAHMIGCWVDNLQARIQSPSAAV